MGNKPPTADELELSASFLRFFKSRARLKAPLLAALRRLKRNRMSAVIFGGTLRDLMLQGPKAEPRDIDVVVDCASVDELVSLFPEYLVRKTRFGGLHLNVRGWAVDIWPLSETWALRESLVKNRDFHALCQTTFLNIEAVTAEMSAARDAQVRIYSHGFFEAIRSSTLDINLEENPFPELCAVRALVTASSLQFGLSKRLARYVLHYLERTAFEQLEGVQLSHYGFVRCDAKNLLRWRDSIKSQIGHSERVHPLEKVASQLKFWCNCTRSNATGCHSRCYDSIQDSQQGHL